MIKRNMYLLMTAIAIQISAMNPFKVTTIDGAMSVFEKAKRDLKAVQAHNIRTRELAYERIEAALDAQYAAIAMREEANKTITAAHNKLVAIGKILNGK